jgi:hypothetical protein
MPVLELIQEVQRQREAKRDFIVPAGGMEAKWSKVDGRNAVVMTLDLEKPQDFLITSNGHQQLSNFTGIPRGYYDRMLEKNPDLLTKNINSWFDLDPLPRRLVRTLDNRIRALLSDRYQPYDNYPLAIMALKMINEKSAKIKSSNITEDKMILKATLPSLQAPDPGPRRVGQFIQAGVSISNSEVGLGSVRVDPLAYILACLNGMIGEHALRRRHLGRQFDVNDQAYEVITSETRKKAEEAFWMQVRDVLNSSFDEEQFLAMIKQMEDATEKEIPKGADIPAIVETTVKDYNLPVGLKEDILDSFIREGDLTQYGLMNALTGTANTQSNYDISTQLEKVGGKIVELKPTEWEVLVSKKVH